MQFSETLWIFGGEREGLENLKRASLYLVTSNTEYTREIKVSCTKYDGLSLFGSQNKSGRPQNVLLLQLSHRA